MKRRTFLAMTVAAMAGLGGPARADAFADELVKQLKRQGYRTFRISRTFLGRTRIVAFSDTSRREVVFNPRTGEILRDFWQGNDGTTGSGLFSADDEEAQAPAKGGGDDSGDDAGDDGGDDGGDGGGDDGGDDGGDSGGGSGDSGDGDGDGEGGYD